MTARRLTTRQLFLDVLVQHLEPGRTTGVDSVGREKRVNVAFGTHACPALA